MRKGNRNRIRRHTYIYIIHCNMEFQYHTPRHRISRGLGKMAAVQARCRWARTTKKPKGFNLLLAGATTPSGKH